MDIITRLFAFFHDKQFFLALFLWVAAKWSKIQGLLNFLSTPKKKISTSNGWIIHGQPSSFAASCNGVPEAKQEGGVTPSIPRSSGRKMDQEWYTRWWFQFFFMFTPIWGNDPIWLIFFRWVETTNQYISSQFEDDVSGGKVIYKWVFFFVGPFFMAENHWVSGVNKKPVSDRIKWWSDQWGSCFTRNYKWR